MDKVSENVLELCSRAPEVKYNYSALVMFYWFLYNTKAWNSCDFENLASPESIGRAYRRLVANHSILLDDEPRTLTEVLDSDNTQRKTHYEEEQPTNSLYGQVS